MEIKNVEFILRLLTVPFLVITACLIGLDAQTKVIFYVERKVTYKYLDALRVMLYVDAVAAAYNLFQLVRYRCSLSAPNQGKFNNSYIYAAWFCYLLDQMAVYVTFAATTAAVEHSILVVTGSKVLQWLQWCDRFTRFCFQIGAAMLAGYAACALMALISFISAFNLFRFYSSQQLLVLKRT